MQQMKRANTTERFRRMGLLVALGGAAAIAVPTSGHAADACAAIKDLKIEDTTITSSESVPAGSFTAPNSKSYANLPAFCRVTATLSPMHDSAIRIEMWLPQGGWKGVFEGTGNGGYSGVFNYPILAAGLSRGYAVINTDEGTAPATPLNGDAVVGHPVKWRDWGFRSTHLMTVAGKQIARAFYSKEPDHAYFSGCSTGGQQALSEAQLYPADYDGIAAGAPVVNRTHLHAAFVWSRQAAERSPGSVLGHDKLMLLKKAVVAACAPGSSWRCVRYVRRRPAPLRLRSGLPRLQSGRRARLPDAGTGRDGEALLCGSDEPAHRRADLSGLAARKRRSGLRLGA